MIFTLGEDFPFTRLSSLMRRQQLTKVLKQIFHLAPALALSNLVADSQFGGAAIRHVSVRGFIVAHDTADLPVLQRMVVRPRHFWDYKLATFPKWISIGLVPSSSLLWPGGRRESLV